MRTTYKTLCTVFNLFMLHDYMVCYHVVLTEMVPSELFPVACRLDRERG